MELRHLRYFVSAATELSLSGASRKLRISQPAISRIIADLECELGIGLFTRNHFGLRLTPAGELFLIRAQNILHDCEEAVSLLKSPVTMAPKLNVGFITTALGSSLGNALRKFSEHRPDVEIRLHDLAPGEQILALRNRQIDLAFVGNACKELDHEFDTLVAEEINLQAVLPSTHRLSGQTMIELKELEQDKFIGYVEDKFPGRNQTISSACARAGFRPTLFHKASSLNEVLGMIGAGMGVCLMPSDVITLPHQNVIFISLADDIEPVRILAAWLPDNRNASLRNLLECLTG